VRDGAAARAARLVALAAAAAIVYVFAAAWLSGPPFVLPAVLAGVCVAILTASPRQAVRAGGAAGAVGGAVTTWYVDAAATTWRLAHLPAFATRDAQATFFGTFIGPLMQYNVANLYFADPLGRVAFALLALAATALVAGLASLAIRRTGVSRRLASWALILVLACAFVTTAWLQTAPFRARIAHAPRAGTYAYDANIFLGTYYEMGNGLDYYHAHVAAAAGDSRLIAEHAVRDGRFYLWATSPAFVRQPWAFWLWQSIPGGAVGVWLLGVAVAALMLPMLLWAFEPYLGPRAVVVPLLLFPLLMAYVVWIDVFFPDFWSALAILAGICLVLRKRWYLAGALALAAALFRETAAAWLLVLTCGALLFRLRGDRAWRGRLLAFGGLFAAFAVAYALHYHAAGAVIASVPRPMSVSAYLAGAASMSFADRFDAPYAYITYAYGFYQLPVWLFAIAQLPGLALVLRRAPQARVVLLAYALGWSAFMLTVSSHSSYWGLLFVPLAISGTAALAGLALPEPSDAVRYDTAEGRS
jgi:hypothetical protein